MSRLNDLICQVGLTNEALAADLQREVAALADRRSFGLNFERHVPEAVELPGRPVRRGDKVRILPPRGQTARQADQALWQVTRIDRSRNAPLAELVALGDETEATTASVEDLVVVAEFRDPIYPGLVSTGKVERGGDKPFHTVINAENYHALQTLLFTHRGRVDAIYIDPPYNSGSTDWKYNNHYVASDDHYLHSKWLAFMERRLLLAKELLNPSDSVLIVTIDHNEVNRLSLLLEQTFPGARMQMVTSVINPRGKYRANDFARCEEYVFFLAFGDAIVQGEPDDDFGTDAPIAWRTFRRSDISSKRGTAKGGTGQFFPVYVTDEGKIAQIGSPLPHGVPRTEAPILSGCTAVFPMRDDGTEMNWGLTVPAAKRLLAKGYLRVGRHTPDKPQPWELSYLTSGRIADIEEGRALVTGHNADGSVVASYVTHKVKMPVTTWNRSSHNAETQGTELLKALLGEKLFDFPKSLYAVEDALRLFVADKPQALVVDFFCGSGTTGHAVMRLNKQDGGRRRSICITNNELSATEEDALRGRGLRPGDPDWERWGICEYITKPRISSAVTGRTPSGDAIKGDYKFGDEFPMADGFEENVEFFTLTYEAPLRVASHRDFERIAPLLWLRAGSRGRRIQDVTQGWDVAEAYGVLADLDQVEPFLKAVTEQEELGIAFIVTDEDRLFESVVRELPDHVEPVRLYEAYLRNFEIESGRGAR
ncbi:MAG: site-specific DNA-methyltransferase [Actinomycetales bacterium]